MHQNQWRWSGLIQYHSVYVSSVKELFQRRRSMKWVLSTTCSLVCTQSAAAAAASVCLLTRFISPHSFISPQSLSVSSQDSSLRTLSSLTIVIRTRKILPSRFFSMYHFFSTRFSFSLMVLFSVCLLLILIFDFDEIAFDNDWKDINEASRCCLDLSIAQFQRWLLVDQGLPLERKKIWQ